MQDALVAQPASLSVGPPVLCAMPLVYRPCGSGEIAFQAVDRDLLADAYWPITAGGVDT